VEHRGAGFDLPRIDAAEGDRADERIIHDLEREHGERLVIGRATLDRLLGLEVDAGDGLAICGRGKKIDHRIKKRLHALVLKSRTAKYRMEFAPDHRLADELAKRLRVKLLSGEISGHGVIVEVDASLDELGSVFGSPFLEV